MPSRLVPLTLAWCVLLSLTGSPSAGQNPPQTLRVMTYNIRYDNPADSLNSWPHRRDFVASLIRYHHPQIIGTQEALAQQLADLATRLPGYRWCGVGRDDGGTTGEYCAIFYDSTAVRLVRDSTFWLSPTPGVPSKGWDAALNRICTWAELELTATGQRCFVFNTHFDHVGVLAREQSAHLLWEQMSRIAESAPVVVVGDFNSQLADPPVQFLTSPPGETRLLDALSASATPHHGPLATFNGFNVRNPLNEQRIDFIFVRPNTRVLAHAILTDFKPDLRFPSDHLPVVADLELP